ncbi:S-adenosyl-L-methionine-dependent methyltransferase [Aspergillus ibericus CBS 121593]|uniref:S-adenosyl-L-methionine-dependent methyltransferase n=1 Tax=Aspergillus ibericus CBS 121593 TaxID=1448316 RepID=A0A395GKT8_9EURO|nr:S-adenosyl-L-methionine-dependent methyltransferase [Aspergillus ibericus CBS 121593]RAK95942.1 S-adenosyl-L-methionine-dependent methyltransferase [Aspergillus ibericus CBS 121593]
MPGTLRVTALYDAAARLIGCPPTGLGPSKYELRLAWEEVDARGPCPSLINAASSDEGQTAHLTLGEFWIHPGSQDSFEFCDTRLTTLVRVQWASPWWDTNQEFSMMTGTTVGLSAQLERYASQASSSACAIATHLRSLEREPEIMGGNAMAAPGIATAQLKLAEAAFELLNLSRDPGDILTHLTADLQLICAVRWLCHFNIPSLIPEDGSPITYPALARAAQVPEPLLRSTLRLAMTSRLFQEPGPSPDLVAHSPVSRWLASHPGLAHWGRYFAHTVIPTAVRHVDATDTWPGSQKLHETAHNLAFNHEGSFFEYISHDGALTVEFSSSMNALSGTSAFSHAHTARSYDWASLGHGLVVDMGGSTGHVSVALAEVFPHLQFLVQDLPEVIADSVPRFSERTLPLAIHSRIRFEGHSFFTPQRVQGASVYLLRHILHDWPDREAVLILRNIVPALGPESRILISDIVLPPPGSIPSTEERVMRCNDLLLHQFTNTLERTLEDWEALVTQASDRLRIRRVSRDPGSILSLNGDATGFGFWTGPSAHTGQSIWLKLSIRIFIASNKA